VEVVLVVQIQLVDQMVLLVQILYLALLLAQVEVKGSLEIIRLQPVPVVMAVLVAVAQEGLPVVLEILHL
jgi:hypothetical protein